MLPPLELANVITFKSKTLEQQSCAWPYVICVGFFGRVIGKVAKFTIVGVFLILSDEG